MLHGNQAAEIESNVSVELNDSTAGSLSSPSKARCSLARVPTSLRGRSEPSYPPSSSERLSASLTCSFTYRKYLLYILLKASIHLSKAITHLLSHNMPSITKLYFLILSSSCYCVYFVDQLIRPLIICDGAKLPVCLPEHLLEGRPMSLSGPSLTWLSVLLPYPQDP